MRICVYTDSFLPYCSGVTFAVASQACELTARGHEVTIVRARPWFSSSASQTAEVSPSISLVDLPISLRVPGVADLHLAAPVCTSLRQVAKFDPDVIHVATEWGAGWEGVIASRFLRRPLVGTFHTFFADPGYVKAFGLPDIKLIRYLMWRYEVNFFNLCDVVTSPSQAVSDALVDQGLPQRPVVISNGIVLPERANSIDITQLRKRYGLNGDGPIYIYVGRVSKEKSLDVVIRAFHKVVERDPSARFVLVGDGPSRPALSRLIGELGLSEHVLELGLIDHDELINNGIPLLGDVFVTASKTENQPVSLLEAMAFGLPIIGPRSRGIPELICDGTNGLLFSPDDEAALAEGMLMLGARPDMCSSMGIAAKRIARTHSVSGSVDRLEQVYDNAMQARRRVFSPRPSAGNPTPPAPSAPAPTAQWSPTVPDRHADVPAVAGRRAS